MTTQRTTVNTYNSAEVTEEKVVDENKLTHTLEFCGGDRVLFFLKYRSSRSRGLNLRNII